MSVVTSVRPNGDRDNKKPKTGLILSAVQPQLQAWNDQRALMVWASTHLQNSTLAQQVHTAQLHSVASTTGRLEF